MAKIPLKDATTAPDSEPQVNPADALRSFARLSVDVQREKSKVINAAFVRYVDSNPTREDFAEVTEGLLVTSVMVWHMARAGRG